MSTQLAVRLSAEELAALDEVVALSRFPTRAAAIRHALALLLRDERERGIEAAYERGYRSKPQEDWIGETGLAAFAAHAAAEEIGSEPL